MHFLTKILQEGPKRQGIVQQTSEIHWISQINTLQYTKYSFKYPNGPNYLGPLSNPSINVVSQSSTSVSPLNAAVNQRLALLSFTALENQSHVFPFCIYFYILFCKTSTNLKRTGMLAVLSINTQIDKYLSEQSRKEQQFSSIPL